MSDPENSESVPAPAHDRMVEQEMRRRSRRAFLIGGGAMLAGIAGFRWISGAGETDGAPWPLRRVLELNEGIARGYFSHSHLAGTYPVSKAGMPRANGMYGLDGPEPAGWDLTVEGGDGAKMVSLAEIRSLPYVEMVTELRCIEGWSQVVRWGGARLVDFTERFVFPSGAGSSESRVRTLPGYVSMRTPDNGYYVGLDIESAMHPQTLLCYSMDGRPLLPQHGAPLRLVIPVKYGIKNIKRIGTITYTPNRPEDFWAKQGYDWYAGL